MSEDKSLTVGQLAPKVSAYELDSSKSYIIILPESVSNTQAIQTVEALGKSNVRAIVLCSDKVRVYESVSIMPVLFPLTQDPTEKVVSAEVFNKLKAKKASTKKSATAKAAPRKKKVTE